MWLRQVFVHQFADIRRDEWPQAGLLSMFFFLVIATFWILKPLKRRVLINYYAERPLPFSRSGPCRFIYVGRRYREKAEVEPDSVPSTA